LRKLFISILGEEACKVLDAHINAILSVVTRKIFYAVSTHIEHKVLALNSPQMYGSHSVIAKDEPFQNENFNYLAQRMAAYTDKNIIAKLFCNTDLQQNTFYVNDFENDLREEFLHPGLPDAQKIETVSTEQGKIKYSTCGMEFKRDAATNSLLLIDILKWVIKNIAKGYVLRFEAEFIRINNLHKSDVKNAKLSIGMLFSRRDKPGKRPSIEPLILQFPYQKIRYWLQYEQGKQTKIAKPEKITDVYATKKYVSSISPQAKYFFNKTNSEIQSPNKGLAEYINEEFNLGNKKDNKVKVKKLVEDEISPTADTIELMTIGIISDTIFEEQAESRKSEREINDKLKLSLALEYKLKIAYLEFINKYISKKYFPKPPQKNERAKDY
jgi:hypothetical protein